MSRTAPKLPPAARGGGQAVRKDVGVEVGVNDAPIRDATYLPTPWGAAGVQDAVLPSESDDSIEMLPSDALVETPTRACTYSR